MKTIFALFAILITSGLAQADCQKINDVCTVNILSLRPAQFSVGLEEINAAVQTLQGLSPKKLQKEIAKKPALVVLGPEGSLFVVDRNHFARELLLLNISQMQAQVVDDASQMSWSEFWNYAEAHNEIYLYNERGEGPLDPSLLPKDLLSLKDDPYRSLAVMARDQGCYDKSNILFADFQWGQFFRQRVPLAGTTAQDLQQALPTAMGLCGASEASQLPGFKP